MKIMNKLQNRKEELKKNNKGFSLVELIIVIAIMAILVGIVGTQVIPYIDKSRNAKDIQKLSGLCTDAMTAYSSNASNLDPAVEYTITIGGTGATDISVSGGTATEQAKLKEAFQELNNIKTMSDLKLESKSGKATTQVDITCKNGDPMIKVDTTVTSPEKDFADITSK